MEDVVPVSRELINSSGIDPMMLIPYKPIQNIWRHNHAISRNTEKISDKLDSDLVLYSKQYPRISRSAQNDP